MKRRRKGRRGKYPHGRPRKGRADRINIGVVDLLDAYAGRMTSNSEPIPMATVSRDDTVETIAFTLRDAKRVAIYALAVLAEFDVPLAKQIIEQHFLGEGGIQLDRMDADGF
jgi:hypothetical protein